MNLPLTSLIPTVIELARFWDTNWPDIWWFPYWYLGVPFRFLTGPVIPLLVIFLSHLSNLSNLSHLSIYLGLIGVIWLIGGAGVYFFVRTLGGEKRRGRLTAGLFLLLPISLWLLQFGTGLSHLAFGLLPWLFLSITKIFRSRVPPSPAKPDSGTSLPHLSRALTVLILSLILLINPATMLSSIVGMIVLALLGEQKNWGKNLLSVFFIWLISFGIATIWYTPAYWLTVLFNPSLGGKSLVKVIEFVGQLLVSAVPLVFGLYSVQKKYKVHSRLTIFAVFFGGFFIFLTVIRMLFDIDFWMDWTTYGLEIQLFLAIVMPLILQKIRYIFRQFVILFIFLIVTIIDIWLVGELINNPDAKIYKKNLITQIAAVDQTDARWFFSGSPVFWLEGEYERVLPRVFPQKAPQGDPFLGEPQPASPAFGFFQVRGAKDQAATNPVWADGAYQIREGDPTEKGNELLNLWLKVLGVNYIVVHSSGSREPFRDFKNLDRFRGLELISEENGDFIYKTGNSLARVADRAILQVNKPGAGNDIKLLHSYLKYFKADTTAKFVKATEISLEAPELTTEEVISLSATFDPGWKTNDARLVKDRFGQMLVLPEKSGVLILKYRENWWGSMWGFFISIIGLLGFRFTNSITQKLSSRIGQFDLEDDEQENY